MRTTRWPPTATGGSVAFVATAHRGDALARVFLSYERHARPSVELLAADLRRAGFEPFFDEQLTGGRSWWAQLLDQIEQCDTFIPALSAAYVQSVPCRREAEYAHALGKPVLPVMVEAMNPAECADFIAEAHCVTYTPGDSSAALDLMRALMQLPDAPTLAGEMPPRPDIPMSYVAASIQGAKDRIESPADLSLDDQIRLMSDIRSLLADHEDTARTLLVELRARRDLTIRIADEIDALLRRPADPARAAPTADPKRPARPGAAEVALPPPTAPRPRERSVFISYRRDDSGPYARRLYDALSHEFDGGRFFLGIDRAVPGWDLDKVLAMLDLSDVLLVVIAPGWVSLTGADGQRRIDDADDYVRLQIERALTGGRPEIVPVLVDGARVPGESDLPASLAALARCAPVELRDDRWEQTVRDLVAAVERLTPDG